MFVVVVVGVVRPAQRWQTFFFYFMFVVLIFTLGEREKEREIKKRVTELKSFKKNFFC
mgnify:CR=1 FL=1